MRKLILTSLILYGLGSFIAGCGKDITAPKVDNQTEPKKTPTEYVAQYLSNKTYFPSIDSVVTSGENVIAYGDFKDPNNSRDSTYSNGEIVNISRTPKVNHINVDVGEKDMTDGAPTLNLRTGYSTYFLKRIIDVFYSIFSVKGDGPSPTDDGYIWDLVLDNINEPNEIDTLWIKYISK